MCLVSKWDGHKCKQTNEQYDGCILYANLLMTYNFHYVTVFAVQTAILICLISGGTFVWVKFNSNFSTGMQSTFRKLTE